MFKTIEDYITFQISLYDLDDDQSAKIDVDTNKLIYHFFGEEDIHTQQMCAISFIMGYVDGIRIMKGE